MIIIYTRVYYYIFITPCDKHSTLEYIECDDDNDDDDDDDNNIVVAAALFAAARNSILPVNPFVRVTRGRE